MDRLSGKCREPTAHGKIRGVSRTTSWRLRYVCPTGFSVRFEVSALATSP
ncbi:hypothetical protein CERSUDRAFT_101385 [Gelatoporia subvermispora B]|uniref:Uncharacterized protein n=1 Tax=Ceriporiopsis subvermispora (strain B) TaxID=914234 RepID=M2P5E4_CERS8|nr:hypothetical protein CERSUDRAFT_101457 [Gelatoporia subvermispora B]EMD30434.1 hypothetical protein CERSUDRAFT_101385 [Gelatoporia subvermispora B]